jgi:hypothetical protein
VNFVKVESSQIAEVGFGDGLYGSETLALRFPPNKKQLAGGEPGSEYHYGNVSVRDYQALMAAESIGSHFGQNIKSKPDLYPFTKVETKSPKIPFDEDSPIDRAAAELPTPSTALTVIDTMADDLLFTPGSVTDAMILAGREWYLAEAKKYDITTEKARTELKRFARPLQKLRTGIEARAKELTGATKRKIAAIDAEKRRLVMLVGGIEDDVLAPLTAWEQEEETRKNRLNSIVNHFAVMAQAYHPDIPTLTAEIAELESFDVSTMQEYRVSAESAIAASLRVLKPELERRKVAEANEAELAELRRKQAERDEADCQAEAKRKEDERIASAVEAAKQEIRQEVIAELKAPVVDPGYEYSMSAREVREEPQPFVYPSVSALTDDQAHQIILGEARGALLAHCGLSIEECIAVVSAIANGLISHVSIQY